MLDQEFLDDLREQVTDRPDRAVESVCRLTAENMRLRWRLAQVTMERDGAIRMLTEPIKELS
jgi:hypothetical protein